MPETAERGVSIVIPCLNEAPYLDTFLQNIRDQIGLPDGRPYEFLIADGGSDDGSREMIERIAEVDNRIRLIHNGARTAASGLNRAIEASRYDTVVRMDVHTEYALDYVRNSVEVLERTGAQCVGGAARTRFSGFMQGAIATAYHSPFSCGGALFHKVVYEGPVDTVTYGCWKKKTLQDLGLFDEEFIRNEDDELNLRIMRSGGRVWQSQRIKSWYWPRDSLWLLFRQYLQYGYWKVRVIQKHRWPASYRHLAPVCFLILLIVLGIASLFESVFVWPFLVVLASYLVASLIACLVACYTKSAWKFLPVMPLVFGTYHLGYGYGFLLGVIRLLVQRRSPASAPLTRRTTCAKDNYSAK
jgi:glycosyltransferase involved in cell wall biosynthesis